MATFTAMEYGVHTCVAARASVRHGAVLVNAIEVLDPLAFPGSDAFSKGLRQARKTLKLPRRLRVVVWGLPDGATRNDPAVVPMIAPLVSAGFRIERVVTPCNALAALARLRAPRFNAATCWLAINRDGVAVVAIRPGKLLYSNSFAWDSTVGATGSQARLLQRYSLVSVLAPEVTRAMTAARNEGTPIEGIVTCGNLPDLRSLTMPLIEELDVEVETLDSFEGLTIKPEVARQLGDGAAAIRIACAAALARRTRPWLAKRPVPVRKIAAAAAVVIALSAIGWLGYRRFVHPSAAKPHQAPIAVANRQGGRRTEIAPQRRPAVSQSAGRPPIPAATPAIKTSALPGRSSEPPIKAPAPPQTRSESTATAPAIPANPPPSHDTRTALPVSTGISPIASGRLPRIAPPAALNSATARGDTREARHAAPIPPPLLKDPLPRVTGILVSDERRFATLEDGRVITIGDVIGRRQVVAIDARAIVLREPSGVQLRVGLGGKLEDIRRTPR
jgi:hypothetical protein